MVSWEASGLPVVASSRSLTAVRPASKSCDDDQSGGRDFTLARKYLPESGTGLKRSKSVATQNVFGNAIEASNHLEENNDGSIVQIWEF